MKFRRRGKRKVKAVTKKDVQQDKTIRHIERVLAPEVKQYIFDSLVFVVGATGVIAGIGYPIQGDAPNQRSGVKIRILSMETFNTYSTGAFNTPQQCFRWGYVVDKQHNGTANTYDASVSQVTGVFNTNSHGATIDSAQRQRYRLIRDSFVCMTYGQQTVLPAVGVGVVGTGTKAVKYRKTFGKSGLLTTFNSANGGATDITTNYINFFGCTDSGTVNVRFITTIWYSDI